MSAIKAKLGSSSNSLRAYAAARGLSAPDSMSEFDSWLNTIEAIDFTYTAGGSYKGEGTLLVTSATGGSGTKTWYLNNGSAGAYTGPYTINTNTQTGLGNQIYTMKVVDTDAGTADKLYQYTFNLPRRAGTSMTLYWVLQSSVPSPTSTSGWSSGTVETNTYTTGTAAEIFAAASKFLIGNSISGLGNVLFWVSDGATYKQAFHPTSGDADAFFEVAQNQTLTSTTGAGTTLPGAPPPPPPPPPPPTYYLFNLKYHSSDAYTACNAIGTNPFYSTCNSLTNGCTLLNDAYGYASNGYYSDGSTVYYVEGNGYINTTSACTAPPPPPPPPPTAYYYDYVRCTGVNAYVLPIYTVSITGDMPSGGITIAGQCFSAVDGIAYTGTANYPIRSYVDSNCGCE